MVGPVGGIGVGRPKVGRADLERERGVRGEHLDEFVDRQFACTQREAVVEGLDDELLGRRCRRVAQLDIRQSGWIDRSHVGDCAAGSGKMQVVDQHARVRPVDCVEHGGRLWEITDRHEGHELEAAPDAVRRGEIAEFTEALDEPVVVDASGHDQKIAGADGCCCLDHRVAAVAVRGHEDRLHVERDQTGVVEPPANLGGNGVGPRRGVVPDAAGRPAGRRARGHELGRPGVRAHSRCE